MDTTDVITKLREYGYYILYENLQVRYLTYTCVEYLSVVPDIGLIGDENMMEYP